MVGISRVLPIFFKIERDFKSPMPVKLSILVRLAFLKLPLKTKGSSRLLEIERILLAISRLKSSSSIMQGPAIRRKFCLFENLSF